MKSVQTVEQGVLDRPEKPDTTVAPSCLNLIVDNRTWLDVCPAYREDHQAGKNQNDKTSGASGKRIFGDDGVWCVMT